MPVQEMHAPQSAVIQLAQSMQEKAQAISAMEGVTLNEFVNIAVAEKLAHHAHMEWVKRRTPVTDEELAEARAWISRPSNRPPDPGDELPEGW